MNKLNKRIKTLETKAKQQTNTALPVILISPEGKVSYRQADAVCKSFENKAAFEQWHERQPKYAGLPPLIIEIVNKPEPQQAGGYNS